MIYEICFPLLLLCVLSMHSIHIHLLLTILHWGLQML